MLTGIDLSALGLGPERVKECVSVLRKEWNKVVPRAMSREWGSQDQFLVVSHENNRLVARITDQSSVPLGEADMPLIVYNASRNLLRNVVTVHYFPSCFSTALDQIIEEIKKQHPEMLQVMKDAAPNIRGALKDFAKYFTQHSID